MSGALVHEWLEPTGGAENVFEAMCQVFPDADRYCLWNNARERFQDVHESPLSGSVFARSKAAALPVMPIVWRTLPSRELDWLLVSSHLFAHHARFRGEGREARKFVYAHTPARYIWEPELDRRGSNVFVRGAAHLLRPLDKNRAAEAVALAANSSFVAKRISRVWDREATVIYPPVDVGRFREAQSVSVEDEEVVLALPPVYLLAVSRWVPYKGIDKAIHVGNLTGVPVVVAGSGPDEARLRHMAEQSSVPVSFVLRPSDALLSRLYRDALALVFPAIEDFGIVPVEAMASGTPVITGMLGGASESVLDGVTGVHIEDWSSHAQVRLAVERVGSIVDSTCVKRALQFDSSVFKDQIRKFVQ